MRIFCTLMRQSDAVLSTSLGICSSAADSDWRNCLACSVSSGYIRLQCAPVTRFISRFFTRSEHRSSLVSQLIFTAEAVLGSSVVRCAYIYEMP